MALSLRFQQVMSSQLVDTACTEDQLLKERADSSSTHRAVEALAVVVVVEGLHPSVAGLDREAAGDALGREQLVPICKREVVSVYLSTDQAVYSGTDCSGTSYVDSGIQRQYITKSSQL